MASVQVALPGQMLDSPFVSMEGVQESGRARLITI